MHAEPRQRPGASSRIRPHLAEFRTRLSGLAVTRHGSQGCARFIQLTVPALETEADALVDRSFDRLGQVAAQVKSGIESVNMIQIARQQAHAEKDQAQSRKFQDRITFLGAILLGPGLVAAFFGANVGLPGRDKVLGTIIMAIVMVAVGIAALRLFPRHRDHDPKDAAPTPVGTA